VAEKYTFFPGKELSARLFAKHSKYMRTIRTIVNLPEGTPFPRCPCKSRVKVRQFEEKGDYSHSSTKHAPCKLCQCHHVAGHMSKGYYWAREEDDPLWWYIGHYGVGHCHYHEKYDFRTVKWQRADRHVYALRRYAWAREESMDTEVAARGEADVIVRNQQQRENIQMLQDRLRQSVSVIQHESDKNEEILTALEAILNQIESRQKKFTKAQFAALQGTLEDRIWRESRLTETAGGKVIEMTDKTGNDQLIKLALGISKLNLDDVKIRAEDMIHIEEITKRIPMLLDLIKNTFRDLHQRWVTFDQDKDSMPELLNDVMQSHMSQTQQIFMGMSKK